MRGPFPLRRCALTFYLLLLGILAGCGGTGADEPTAQTVRGPAWRSEAPLGWKVTREHGTTAAASGDVDRVEVRTFALSRPYRPRLFAAAVRELDSASERIAQQLDGRVTSRRTTRVADRKVRAYTIEYDGKTAEITFVLDGKREFQLLCRRATSGNDSACRRLVASFALAR